MLLSLRIGPATSTGLEFAQRERLQAGNGPRLKEQTGGQRHATKRAAVPTLERTLAKITRQLFRRRGTERETDEPIATD